MKTLRTLARAALKELRKRPFPKDHPQTRALTNRLNGMTGSMQHFPVSIWTRISTERGKHFDRDVDLYLWVRWTAGEMSLLSLSNSEQHEIAQKKLIEDAIGLGEAILKVAPTKQKVRRRRKRK